ncbi:MAG: VOC family protein [Rikenellaceae bacterium]|jgi:predicted enzyme related to lactoylglutathione lyase|nr:VOC family protein [Rikenellaceae bacterium]
MKNFVVFFEIPAADFQRAVAFYTAVFGLELAVVDCGTEKMACFPGNVGAISWAEGLKPGSGGVLVSLRVDDMERALTAVAAHGGRVTHPKTKIEADGMGYFANIIDSEGNQIGLYSDK